MQPAPGHPYVSYQAGADMHNQWWIDCACSLCGDVWRKRCLRPQRTDAWVIRYCALHAHGLSMRAAR